MSFFTRWFSQQIPKADWRWAAQRVTEYRWQFFMLRSLFRATIESVEPRNRLANNYADYLASVIDTLQESQCRLYKFKTDHSRWVTTSYMISQYDLTIDEHMGPHVWISDSLDKALVSLRNIHNDISVGTQSSDSALDATFLMYDTLIDNLDNDIASIKSDDSQHYISTNLWNKYSDRAIKSVGRQFRQAVEE